MTNVTILSLCEQNAWEIESSDSSESEDWKAQIDEMLNCDEANCAFATLQKKMEQDERQKRNKNKITVWLFNNTYLGLGITFKKHFYNKHIRTIHTLVELLKLFILTLPALLLFIILWYVL